MSCGNLALTSSTRSCWPSNRTLVGEIGLHGRAGDGGIEIGYWIDVRYSGRGLGTEAAGALTSVALALPGVAQAEIHCDEENQASAAIPRKLGYRLDRIDDHEPEAPGERGHRMVWVMERATRRPWAGRQGSPGDPAVAPGGMLAAAAALTLAACGPGAPEGTGAPRWVTRGGPPRPTPTWTPGSAGRPPRAGLPAGQPVRPADVAEPVPRPGRSPGLRRFAVHDGVPADHGQHGGSAATARRRREPRATARRGRQPQGHSVADVHGLSAGPRHGQPVGLPHRLARAARGRLEGLRHRRADPRRA